MRVWLSNRAFFFAFLRLCVRNFKRNFHFLMPRKPRRQVFGLINDISFEIGGKLVILIEHQSTINPNMALRLLLYIARVYENVFRDKSLYSGKSLRIPRPEFFVLYNGSAPFPDEEVLRLSDAFEKTESLGLPEPSAESDHLRVIRRGSPPEKASLELEVRVININEGRNTEISGKCRRLAEYSAFIAKVRAFELELGDKGAAMKAGIKYCLEHDILREFLEEHSTEVFNMLITEWNTEEAKEVWYEEGLEQGREEGRAEIARNALKKGLPIEMIHDITGLDTETINKLKSKST